MYIIAVVPFVFYLMHISKHVGGQGCNDPQHRNAKITAIEALPQTDRLDFNFLVNILYMLVAKGETTNSSALPEPPFFKPYLEKVGRRRRG